MSKTAVSSIYYFPNHGLAINNCPVMPLINSPVDFNNNSNTIILHINNTDSQHGSLHDSLSSCWG